jgi:hypothetical protein
MTSDRLSSPDLERNQDLAQGTHTCFRFARIVTFGSMALGHCMQDAQQTMRSITPVPRGVAGNIVAAVVG